MTVSIEMGLADARRYNRDVDKLRRILVFSYFSAPPPPRASYPNHIRVVLKFHSECFQ